MLLCLSSLSGYYLLLPSWNGGGRVMSERVSEGLLHKLFPRSAFGSTWMTDSQMSLKSPRIMFGVSVPVCRGVRVCWRSLLKCVCVCVMCVCVFMYVHGRSGEWENKWEWACRRVSASSCVTYVLAYPCMRCLRKYKTQKDFRCNVHLSVSVHLFLCFQLKQRCTSRLLIINNHRHQTLSLHPWSFSVNSRMSHFSE